MKKTIINGTKSIIVRVRFGFARLALYQKDYTIQINKSCRTKVNYGDYMVDQKYVNILLKVIKDNIDNCLFTATFDESLILKYDGLNIPCSNLHNAWLKEPSQWYDLDRELVTAAKQVADFTSKDTLKRSVNMNCVYFDGEAQSVVATDGRRIGIVEKCYKFDTLLMPCKIVKMLPDFFYGDLHIQRYDHTYEVQLDGFNIEYNLVCDKFASWKRVVPILADNEWLKRTWHKEYTRDLKKYTFIKNFDKTYMTENVNNENSPLRLCRYNMDVPFDRMVVSGDVLDGIQHLLKDKKDYLYWQNKATSCFVLKFGEVKFLGMPMTFPDTTKFDD